MSYKTTFNGDHKVLKCSGIPQYCEGCWNNPYRLKQAFDIRVNREEVPAGG